MHGVIKAYEGLVGLGLRGLVGSHGGAARRSARGQHEVKRALEFGSLWAYMGLLGLGLRGAIRVRLAPVSRNLGLHGVIKAYEGLLGFAHWGSPTRVRAGGARGD